MLSTTDFLALRNTLLNISIQSSQIPQGEYLQIERKDSDNILALRPTMHIFQAGIYGVAKTSSNERIEAYCSVKGIPFKEINNTTFASLVGSITDKGYFKRPLSLPFINGVISVDELKTGTNPNETSQTLGGFLTLLSHEKCSREIARIPKESSKKALKKECKKFGVKCSLDGGALEFRNMRQSWIFSTAKAMQKSRRRETYMLMSRATPIWWFPTRDEMNMVDDNPEYLFNPLKLKKPDCINTPMPNEEYLKIREFVEANFRVQEQADMEKYLTPLYFRTVNDCVRAYAFTGEFDKTLFNFIINNRTVYAERINRIEVQGIRDEIFANM